MFGNRLKKRSTIFAIPEKPRRKKIKIAWRARLFGAGAILILAGVFYLAVWSPFFKIKSWSVESEDFAGLARARESIDKYLQSKTGKIFPRGNWLFFSGNKLSDELLAAYPEIKGAAVEKDIKRGIKIFIETRRPAEIWCQTSARFFVLAEATTTDAVNIFPQAGQCFFGDEIGFLYIEAPNISGIALPKFFGRAEQNISIGDSPVASSTVEFAARLKKDLRFMGIDTYGFMDGAAGSNELIMFSDEGWAAYFDATRSAQSQAQVLATLIADELGGKTSDLKYIDLRLPSRVYYK